MRIVFNHVYPSLFKYHFIYIVSFIKYVRVHWKLLKGYHAFTIFDIDFSREIEESLLKPTKLAFFYFVHAFSLIRCVPLVV